jgi:hypothetical protein
MFSIREVGAMAIEGFQSAVPVEWTRRRQIARPIERPEEALARELARNETNLAVLRRLGVSESTRLPLSFVYETAGPEADRLLADFLAGEAGYRVTIESEGVSGVTDPVELSRAGLEKWAGWMLRAGQLHGGCAFGGWTVAVRAGS